MIQRSMMSFESCDWTLSMTYEIAWDSISFLFPSMKVVRERWQKSMRSIGGIFSFGAPWPRLDKVSTTMHIFKQCLSPCYVKMPIRVKHLWQQNEVMVLFNEFVFYLQPQWGSFEWNFIFDSMLASLILFFS